MGRLRASEIARRRTEEERAEVLFLRERRRRRRIQSAMREQPQRERCSVRRVHAVEDVLEQCPEMAHLVASEALPPVALHSGE